MDASAGPETTPLTNGQNEQLENIHNELKKINGSYNFFRIMGRGFLNGIATGIGATVGLALLLFLLTQLLTTFSYVPFVYQLLTITKLNTIIETKPPITDNSALTPTPTIK
jgi:hypothetical protein